MCRLFAMSGDLSGARALLMQGDQSLAALTTKNADGAGLGWFDAMGVHLDKSSTLDGGLATLGAADDARAGTSLLAHIRYATQGGAGSVDNNHPFLIADRLHAHNGTIGRADLLEDQLGTYRALVNGETDTERWFAFVSKQVDANGGDVPKALVDSADWARTRLPVNSMNSVIARGDDVWALRYPADEPLHVGVGTGAAGRPLAAVGSQPNGNLAWDALELGELVHLRGGRLVSREQVLPEAPLRKLVDTTQPDGVLRSQLAPAAR